MSAFLQSTRGRNRKLGMAALLFGAYGLLDFIGNSIEVGILVDHKAESQNVIAEVLSAFSKLSLLVAGLTASLGFFRASRATKPAQARDGLLGTSAVCLAVGSGAAIVSTLLFVNLYSDLGASGGFTTGLGIDALGTFVAVGGFTLAAVALLSGRVARATNSGTAYANRELLFGIAASVLTASYSVSAVGVTVIAASASDNGFPGAYQTVFWLLSAGTLLIVPAGLCAALGFLNARRKATRPGAGAAP